MAAFPAHSSLTCWHPPKAMYAYYGAGLVNIVLGVLVSLFGIPGEARASPPPRRTASQTPLNRGACG